MSTRTQITTNHYGVVPTPFQVPESKEERLRREMLYRIFGITVETNNSFTSPIYTPGGAVIHRSYILDSIINQLKVFDHSNVELPTKLGYEYTFVSKNAPENTDVLYEKYENLDSKISQNTKLKIFHRIHYDNGVVEIPSPPHGNLAEVFSFYKKLIKLTSNHGLTPYANCSTGGCHIHVDFPNKYDVKELLKFFRTAFIDIANKPYLNWIFNEPYDIYNANSFFSSVEGENMITNLNNRKFYDIEFSEKFDLGPKTLPIRIEFTNKTIEFRFFDMVRSENELRLITNFIIRYYEYLMARSEVGKIVLIQNSKTYNKAKSVKNYLKEFREFLRHLKLDPKDYEIFIKRNYKKRLAWKSYLK